MIKVFATQAIVSKGIDDEPALHYSEEGNFVWFRIGRRIHDAREESGFRWLNYTVKAFGQLCERIQKMKLKEGSWINFMGRLDEDVWEDRNTHEKRSKTVIILEDIEYASTGKPKEEAANAKQSEEPAAPPTDRDAPSGFDGYEPFGGGSFFDED